MPPPTSPPGDSSPPTQSLKRPRSRACPPGHHSSAASSSPPPPPPPPIPLAQAQKWKQLLASLQDARLQARSPRFRFRLPTPTSQVSFLMIYDHPPHCQPARHDISCDLHRDASRLHRPSRDLARRLVGLASLSPSAISTQRLHYKEQGFSTRIRG